MSTSAGAQTASESNATPITQPTTAVTSFHQGQTVSSLQAPTQDYDRANPRWGFQYGYQSNNTPTTTIENRYPPDLHMIWTSGMFPGIVATHMTNVARGMPTPNMSEHPSLQARVTPNHKWTGRMARLPNMVNPIPHISHI